jgi:hypothetical protein
MTEQKNPPPVKLGAWLLDNWGAALTIVLIVLAAFWVGSTILKNPLILFDLRDQAYARGVITFLFSIVTLVMAFLLVIQAFTAKGEDKDAEKRFSRAREVFTVLMGVLGTIVGFYFGSAEKAVTDLEVAEIRVVDKQLLSHISGGARPYRYSIISSDKDFKTIKNRISEDGWIVETLEQPPKAGTTITVDVRDGKDQKVSKESKVGGSSPTQATAQPVPKQPTNSPPETTPPATETTAK